MPDDLYDRDILIWTEHQADLVRRLERGERMDGVDWAHIVEEIECVGLSELHSVQSYLNLMLVRLLKIHRWPDNQAHARWRVEIVACQQNAVQRFAPSKRQRTDVEQLYAEALEQLECAGHDGATPRLWPSTCPFTLDQLLHNKRVALEDVLKAVTPGQRHLAP
jgi:hypothetical protein